ncbi:MAG: N-6 DNA methylase, partial [Gemmatimonadetes bacterium]|nr:N-6 DNA methylase [Gemmatimonadota bacterium]
MAEAGADRRQEEEGQAQEGDLRQGGVQGPVRALRARHRLQGAARWLRRYAFILHILASLTDDGRAGVVCPQGVLFRGQPEVEEETGEIEDDGNPIIKRRKADDEHLIRKALLESGLIDAVISLPLNVFYGAGVPACLLILRKQRPDERRDQVLLIYAARHYRELSAQNELRPQDVMRMLVHYHAYGDAA